MRRSMELAIKDGFRETPARARKDQRNENNPKDDVVEHVQVAARFATVERQVRGVTPTVSMKRRRCTRQCAELGARV